MRMVETREVGWWKEAASGNWRQAEKLVLNDLTTLTQISCCRRHGMEWGAGVSWKILGTREAVKPVAFFVCRQHVCSVTVRHLTCSQLSFRQFLAKTNSFLDKSQSNSFKGNIQLVSTTKRQQIAIKKVWLKIGVPSFRQVELLLWDSTDLLSSLHRVKTLTWLYKETSIQLQIPVKRVWLKISVLGFHPVELLSSSSLVSRARASFLLCKVAL